MYAECVQVPKDIFVYLECNDIAKNLALFYEEYANLWESYGK